MLRRPLLLALTGALAASSLALTPAPEDSRVVVAPIDSGINPYHDAFQVADPAVDEHVLAEFGVDADHVLHISRNYQQDVADGVYADVREGELYHFAGTNILAYSTDFGSRPFLPDDSGDTHGTGVTGSVVAANPEAIILFVEGTGSASEDYAFTHPGVDMVTTSYGFVTSVPLGNLSSSYEGVVEQGKLHFAAATNDPTLAPLDGTAGPWWGIAISGYGETADKDGGKETLSGTAPDFVADFTQDVPYCDTCTTGTRSVSGTSFATPRSAGIASKVLLDARRRAGHLGGITEDGLMVDANGIQVSNWELRRALEEGAYVLPTNTGVRPSEQPVNPVAPYTQIGWGALTTEHDVVENTTAYLLDDAPERKGAETCAYMTQYMNARYVAWDGNILSDSFGQTSVVDGTDYIPC